MCTQEILSQIWTNKCVGQNKKMLPKIATEMRRMSKFAAKINAI